MALAELQANHDTPLAQAVYDTTTGILTLVFDYDLVLRSNAYSNARHIDAFVLNGSAYEIELHADDGPRDSSGNYIFNEQTVENHFEVFVGTGIDVSNGLDLRLTDKVNGSGVLYNFSLDPVLDQTPETPVPDDPAALSLFLYDASTNERLAEITSGARLDENLIADRELTLIAETSNEEVESIVLSLDGVHTQTESVAPYALFGDKSGDLKGNDFLSPEGEYDVSLTAYAADKAKGAVLGNLDLSFSVGSVEPEEPETPEEPEEPETPKEPEEPEIPEEPEDSDASGSSNLVVSLIDAASDQLVTTITDGDELDALDGDDYTLSVTASDDDLAAEIGSVRLTFDGQTRVENVSPYALFGDSRGNFFGGTELDGNNLELSVEVFGGKNASGALLTSETVIISVGAPSEAPSDPTPSTPPATSADAAVGTDAAFNGIRLWVANDISEIDDAAAIAPLLLGALNISNSDDNITGSADTLHLEGAYVDTDGGVASQFIDDVEANATAAAQRYGIDIYSPRTDFDIGGNAAQWEAALTTSLDTAYANDEQVIIISGGPSLKAADVVSDWLDAASGTEQADKAVWILQGGFSQITHGWTYQANDNLDYTRDPGNTFFNIRTNSGPNVQQTYEALYDEVEEIAEDGIGSAYSQAAFNQDELLFVEDSLLISIENQNNTPAVRGDADVIGPLIGDQLAQQEALAYTKNNGATIDISDVGMLAILLGDTPLDLGSFQEIMSDPFLV